MPRLLLSGHDGLLLLSGHDGYLLLSGDIEPATILSISDELRPGATITALTQWLGTITEVTVGGIAIVPDSTDTDEVTFTIPVNHLTEWGSTVTLTVSDGSNTAEMTDLIFFPREGWEYVNFDGNIPSALYESFYELCEDDHGYTPLIGDQLRFTPAEVQSSIQSDWEVWESISGTYNVRSASLEQILQDLVFDITVDPGVYMPVLFVSNIPSQMVVEGDEISLDVSDSFTGQISYTLDVSPDGLDLSIDENGVITGTADTPGTFRVVVVAIGAGPDNTAHSNVFQIVVAVDAEGLISGEAIEFEIAIEPAFSDGLADTFYDDNTNTIVVNAVRGQISNQPIVSPSVTGVIRTSAGVSIQALTFNAFSEGWFANVDDEDFSDAVLHITVTGNDATAGVEKPINFVSRTR